MKKTAFFLALFTAHCLFSVPSTLVLDRKKCFSRALEHNAGLLDSALQHEAASRNADNAWNLFLPGITASLGLSSQTRDGDPFEYSLTPQISANYTLRPGLGESIRQLKITMERAQLNYHEVRRRLLLGVDREFYGLLTDQGDLEIHEKNIDLAKKTLELMQVKFSNGLASELEVLQARVNAANLVPAYSSRKSAYTNRLTSFLVGLGLDPETEVELVGSLDIDKPEFDPAGLVSRYLEERNDIQQQRRVIATMESSIRQQSKDRIIPSVSLSASWSDPVSDPFSSGSWTNRDFGGRTTLTLGVSLGIDDLIPGSSKDTAIKNTATALEREKLGLETALKNARLEIITIIDSLDTDRENLDISNLNLDLAETSYRMTELGFTRGRLPASTLDKAQQELLTARQNLLKSRLAYMNNIIALRLALGLEPDETIGTSQ